jgi:hypothetical protein
MSAMKMEKNGRQSAGQRSRHIHIRYFFIKDRIANKEITLMHCPTAIMVAVYFTKPLQGFLFVKFRDIIMGITHHSSLDTPEPDSLRSVLELPGSEGSQSSHRAKEDSYPVPIVTALLKEVSWTTVVSKNTQKRSKRTNL